MRIFHHITEMRGFSRGERAEGRSIALVPTMGCLHEGHLSLIDKAKTHGDIIVVSIFVNPTQFGEDEDFAAYPADIDRDLALCETRGADAVFIPDTAEMYDPDTSTVVDELKLSRGLCGASRPGHFSGVATVVAKLFNIIEPDAAVFGQKDAQQVLIVKRLVRDLNFPVEIVVGPTIRAADGLAMSSRNQYLSTDERRRASSISRAIHQAKERIEHPGDGGEPDVETIVTDVRRGIEAAGGEVDYVELVDAENLERPDTIERPVLVAVAARFGAARLIDNVTARPHIRIIEPNPYRPQG